MVENTWIGAGRRSCLRVRIKRGAGDVPAASPATGPRRARAAAGDVGACEGDRVRVTIRVHPGAKRPRVGGAYDGALVVRVTERAVDGRATEAALAAVAAAFGVPRRDVTLVTGATSRTKTVDVPGADPATLATLLTA